MVLSLLTKFGLLCVQTTQMLLNTSGVFNVYWSWGQNKICEFLTHLSKVLPFTVASPPLHI